MRNIITLTMLRGQVVHSVIAQALNARRYGEKVSVATAREEITRILRQKWFESLHRMWLPANRPPGRKASGITNILEHYYKFPEINDRAKEAQRTAWASVENLMNSDFWHSIMESDAAEWMEIDEDDFPQFNLDGIQVYATIDFAHRTGRNTIIDWKTGMPSADDRKQLTLYGLYAESRWGWDLDDTDLCAVYLQPELRVDKFSPGCDDIESVKELVKRSFEEMAELEPAYGPADVSIFPKTEDKSNCKWCRFMAVCERVS